MHRPCTIVPVARSGHCKKPHQIFADSTAAYHVGITVTRLKFNIFLIRLAVGLPRAAVQVSSAENH